MTTTHPEHGAVTYLELPTTDPTASAAFYADVLGWRTSADGFEAPNVVGQWITDREPAAEPVGAIVWYAVADLYRTLDAVERTGGQVITPPRVDHGERRLCDVRDPSGNRLGLVAPIRTVQAQTLLSVRDVEAASRWYRNLLNLVSDHGGPAYERLLADGVLVLQLHHREVEHHHGAIGDPDAPLGNGVLVWFGEVADFDGVVERAAGLEAEVVRAPHRNPPEGEGNGPAHRELWLRDLDGYIVVVASPDGEAWSGS